MPPTRIALLLLTATLGVSACGDDDGGGGGGGGTDTGPAEDFVRNEVAKNVGQAYQAPRKLIRQSSCTDAGNGAFKCRVVLDKKLGSVVKIDLLDADKGFDVERCRVVGALDIGCPPS